MNKNDLVNKISKKCGLNKRTTKYLICSTIEEISKSLADGEKVQLSGFGTFSLHHRDSRICYNPKTNKKVRISALNAPAFKAGKALKIAVNREKVSKLQSEI